MKWSLGAGALFMLEMSGLGCSRDPARPDLPVKFPPLPYDLDALTPYLSEAALRLHYDRHHRGYVERANRLLEGTRHARQPVEAIIRETFEDGRCTQTALFNNTAQAYNHTFFWNSMKPQGGGEPTELMRGWIEKSFGHYRDFRQAFGETARRHFASGWIWLVLSKGQLEIMATRDAQNPMVFGKLPLLTLDVWEHAYYPDYQQQRERYVEAFLDHLLNWDFAAANLGEV
jgi:Fe-Mn family superoxide dismutase